MPICVTCGRDFERPHTVGRPSKICVECRHRPKSEPKIKGTELVDRLEAMLRSRGTHLGQQKD